VPEQLGALLICNPAVDFDAIDDAPVSIVFALIGPKGRSAQHLKTLAQVSRLLRPPAFRQQLVEARDGAEAYALIRQGNTAA
jgi:PTS system nitrogen regulatory IIA component